MLAEVTLVLLKFEGICSSLFWWNLFSFIFHFDYMKILSYSCRADWFMFILFSSSFCLLAMNGFKLWNINKTNWLNGWRKIRSVIEDFLMFFYTAWNYLFPCSLNIIILVIGWCLLVLISVKLFSMVTL